MKRIERGKYLLERDDGRKFIISKSSHGGWIIEAQDTYSVDIAPTLQCAKSSILNRWTPQSRESTIDIEIYEEY